jgi:hypothetical protein
MILGFFIPDVGGKNYWNTFRIVGFVILVSNINLCTSTESSGEIIFGNLTLILLMWRIG